MIALDVKRIFHSFGVGKGRRIDKDQIELLGALPQPTQHVRLHQAMRAAGQAIETQVAFRPLQVGA